MTPDAEMFDRLRKVEMAQSTHEAVCVERYTNILGTAAETKKALAKIHALGIKIGAALIIGMAAILAKMVFHT